MTTIPCRAKKPLSIMKELFMRLEVVLVLLANALEFHHFLSTSCESLNLSASSSQREGGQGQDAEDTLVSFNNVLVYIFQQAFYSISRVSYRPVTAVCVCVCVCVCMCVLGREELAPNNVGKTVTIYFHNLSLPPLCSMSAGPLSRPACDAGRMYRR